MKTQLPRGREFQEKVVQQCQNLAERSRYVNCGNIIIKQFQKSSANVVWTNSYVMWSMLYSKNAGKNPKKSTKKTTRTSKQAQQGCKKQGHYF